MRVGVDDLPAGVMRQIVHVLSIPNEDKKVARREQHWGWQNLPDFIELWRVNDFGTLLMPRGFKDTFEAGLASIDVKIDWEDRRVDDQMWTEGVLPQSFRLRPHQGPAAKAILSCEQGIYEAPTGSGKTVTVCEVMRVLQRKAIILVGKADIAEQWRERIQQYLGMESGLIGDGVFEERDITIAMVPTLWRRKDELSKENFWERWGMVCMDECHHATAMSYKHVMQMFPARWRFGVSATPKREDWTYPITTTVIGPVIHRTDKYDVEGLIKPSVKMVKTGFRYGFRSSSSSPNGKFRRNNYGQMTKKLVEDPHRNALIIDCLCENFGRTGLVLSKRLEHLHTLRAMLVDAGYPEERTFMLTGEQDREERRAIADLAAEEGDVMIFSTIADEALDIPRLDRVFLVWPQRSGAVVKQQIGRIERAHPDKTDAVVYDFADLDIGVLRSQWQERVREVYRPENLEIKTPSGVV